jgi:hypothetical protein
MWSRSGSPSWMIGTSIAKLRVLGRYTVFLPWLLGTAGVTPYDAEAVYGPIISSRAVRWLAASRSHPE